MDDDLRSLLEENIRLAKDNNRLLRSMRRAAIIGFFGRVLFWVIILGVPAYLYLTYLAPVVSHVMAQGQAGQDSFLRLLSFPTQTLQHLVPQASSSTPPLLP